MVVVPVGADGAAAICLRLSAVLRHIAPALLGFFPFLMMFLITSITTLRERTSGTLERLMTMPMAKLDLLGGYALAFSRGRARAGGRRGAVSICARAATSPARCGRAAGRRCSTRCSAWRWACSPARSRAPSSRQCSSCRWWCCRSCCCAGCSSPREQMADGAALDLRRDAAVVRGRGAAAGDHEFDPELLRTGATSGSCWPARCSDSPWPQRPCGGAPSDGRLQAGIGAGLAGALAEHEVRERPARDLVGRVGVVARAGESMIDRVAEQVGRRRPSAVPAPIPWT